MATCAITTKADMQPPDGSDGSSGTSMAPPVFQSASSVPKSKTPTVGSVRNASGGLPAIPSDSAVAPSSEKPLAAIDATAVPRAKPINRPATSKNAIVYNAVQRRNPVLLSIKNVGIEIGDITADYQVGTHNGVLFLSLKYHRLHPEYIHQRIEKMKNQYNLRIMLVLCDINEHQQSLRELTKIAIINQYTSFVAWSNEEVAQYLTTFKFLEHRGDETLKERIHQSYHDQLQHVLTSGKKVNKTDADNLASQFGSFAEISRQPSKILSSVKGLGATKVTSLIDAFNKPFLVGGLRKAERDGAPAVSAAAGPNGAGGVPTGNTIGKRARGTEQPDEGLESEPAGSPDWPSDAEEEAEEEIQRQRDRVPSRSPGISPEPRVVGDGEGDEDLQSGAWNDPLDEDEVEEDEPASKKFRVD